MRIRAFQGLRPQPDNAAKVAALPYDVVSTEEARALAADNPLSFLHVTRAEIDLPEGTDPYSEAVYAKARENFARLQAEGGLTRETEPCVYLYRQSMGGHSQTGLVTVCHIEDYENDRIKKHEKTRKAKEDDRSTLNRTLRAHPGPVFLTYKNDAKILELTEAAVSGAPFFDFEAPDGVRHTLWRVAGGRAYVDAFAKVPASYVADGHHRAASAARVGKEMGDANPEHTGEEDYNWFLAVLFPAGELNILPYNRVVADLNGLSPEALLEKVSGRAKVTPDAAPSPTRPGEVSMYLGGRWYGLEFAEDASEGPIERLDVSRLQDKILAPLLGIDDPRTSERVDFVGGVRGTEELERRVDAGDWAVAFSMYPVTVEQLMEIADAGAIMPPKSTWFEPKLRSGLVVHTI
ncbi:MAG: DUF1015 domain-containing protein [Opitutales bacterium]|nr:DUF1015 domain-containing protein [Opitutales bacterium]